MYKELINSATRSYPFLTEHKNVRYIPHFHEETEIVYIIDGEVELTLGSLRYTVKKDDICIIPPEVIHNLYTYTSSKTSVIKLYPIVDLSGINLNCNVITKENSLNYRLKEHIYNIMHEEKTKERAYELAVNAYAEQLSVLLLREFNKFENINEINLKLNAEKNFLKDVIMFFEEKNNTDFSLDDISTRFNYSKSYFCRYFKKITGKSLWEYYTMYRIEKSVELIKHSPNESFTVIAHKAGFKNIRSFNTAFKLHTRLTPSEYRKAERK